MDEAVAGHATFIEVELDADGFLTVTDNGRGIPVDPHPKFPRQSALEVIMTTLHAGGKFDCKVYETSGGLHGVGVSVVNALSDQLEVEVARGRQLYRQRFSRGEPQGGLERLGEVQNRRGTRVRFHPDPEIFGKEARFRAGARSIAWRARRPICSAASRSAGPATRSLISDKDPTPAKATFHFPGGLKDFLAASLGDEMQVTREVFAGRSDKQGGHGAVEWAVTWYGGDGFLNSYCNTIPTHEGGTHEMGFRNALTRGLKALCRAHRQQAGGHRHQRGRDDLRRRHAVGVHPRAGIRRPDQGQAGDGRRPSASSRARFATPSTIGWPTIRRKPPSSSTG